ncbi:MAG: helix-turn-helix transcriptional regulator [Clostridia bacterium]|nr:helix-turn-helix transcriptional regulator [Clostridia bacterium]MBQ8371750.1 helix-turn-helix transcriptional regulator [Clostridia bacterium]
MNVYQHLRVVCEDFALDHRTIEDACGDSFTTHIHDTWELLFFLRGNVTYHVEGKSYKLFRGDMVLSRPFVFHHIEPNDGTAYERFNIVFDGKLIPKGIRRLISTETDVFGFGDNPRIYELFDKMEDYAKHFEGEELLRILGHLIEEVIYNIVISEGQTRGQTISNPLVSRALAYIDENLSTVKSIEEISNSLYITKSYLHHLFDANLGVSPKHYITTKRLLLAQKMIRRGKRATEVAPLVGFDDYATFFRNYKRHFGYSPSEESARPNLEIKA